jgi:hypothetical protein
LAKLIGQKIADHLRADLAMITGYKPNKLQVIITQLVLEDQGGQWNAHVHHWFGELREERAILDEPPGVVEDQERPYRPHIKRPTREQRREASRRRTKAALKKLYGNGLE